MPQVAVIGGGPAGLMAAEILATAGMMVTVYERKPTAGRKFLMAGRGGLNLTHSEDLQTFISRYGTAASFLSPLITAFPPAALRAWCEALEQPTFIGSSGRVFPVSLKASPLLRAWRSRLDTLGVRFLFQHDWQGWDEENRLVFALSDGQNLHVKADAVILALGGASWSKLGSDGSWLDIMTQQKVAVSPLRPANCGFVVTWSDIFRNRFAGQPVKPVTLTFAGTSVQGEIMITEKGVEGGAIYALSAPLRDEVTAKGSAIFTLDLRPGLSLGELSTRLKKPRRRQSFSNFLRKEGGLSPIAISLVREMTAGQDAKELEPEALAALIKVLPVCVQAPFPIDKAISTAGGIKLEALDDQMMLHAKPGVFAAGEMLDWEAPTGGYLLQAAFSTSVRAAQSALAWLRSQK